MSENGNCLGLPLEHSVGPSICDQLVIEPSHKGNVLALLVGWDAVEDDFPDFDADQGPPRAVDL